MLPSGQVFQRKRWRSWWTHKLSCLKSTPVLQTCTRGSWPAYSSRAQRYPETWNCIYQLFLRHYYNRCAECFFLVFPIVTLLTCRLRSYTWSNRPVSQLTLSHPELLVAVEMLSSVVLMNQAMDAGDRGALWRQLSSPVTGLSNVEDNYAQRLAERCTGEGRLWSRWLMWILYVPGTWMNWCVLRPQPESRAATI